MKTQDKDVMNNIPKSSFYFVRHGETDWNRKNIIMGSQDIPLNENGITQAEHAAYILAYIEISRVVSSTLTRAIQTANLIGYNCGLEVEKMSYFCERGYGEVEGKNRKDSLPLSSISDKNLPKDGEKYKNFEKRILLGLCAILSSPYKYPLIVSHGGVFDILANKLANRQDILCKNGQISFFTPSVLQANKWEISLLER